MDIKAFIGTDVIIEKTKTSCVLTEIAAPYIQVQTKAPNSSGYPWAYRFVDDYCSYGFGQFIFDSCVSNEALDRRDSRVASEMDRFYTKTKQLLIENKSKLDNLITRLVAEKTLLGDQVQEIIKCA